MSGRRDLIQTLTENWWLLALCGVLEATVSVLYLVLQDQDGPVTFHGWRGVGTLLGKLIVAAGICTIAAGIWRSAKGRCWPLALNGLALGALGLISSDIHAFRGLKIHFATVALLFVVMAVSLGVLELTTARGLRRAGQAAHEWLLGLAGTGAVSFALAFLALGFSWIKIDLGWHFRSLPDFMWSKADFLWFGFYLGFSAICLLGLAWSLRSLGLRAGTS